MYTYPDSARQMLESVLHPERLTGKEQANYALLLSQARSRCRIIATSDSLIRIAADYYQHSNDHARKAAAFLYLADVYMDMKKYTEAIEPLKQAEEVLEESHPAIQSLVYSKLGYLNRESGNYELAFDYYVKAMNIDRTSQNIDWFVSDLTNILNLPISKVQDSASVYIKRLEKTLPNTRPELQAKAYNNIGVYYEDMQQKEQAIAYYQKAIQTSVSVPYRAYSNLARIYDEQGYITRADSLYQVALQTPVWATKARIYEALSRRNIDAGNYLEAVTNLEHYQAATDSFYTCQQAQEIQELQAKYDHEVLARKNISLERNLYLSMLIAIVILFVTSSFIRYYRKKQKEMISITYILQQQIDDLKSEMKAYNEQERGMLQTKIDQLEKLKSIYTSQGYLDIAEIKAAGTMKTIVKELKYVPKSDRIHLIHWLNTYRNGFAVRLEQAYPQLTQERQLDVCYLSAAGFDAKHIARLLGIKERTVERYMTDICKKTQYPEEGKKGFQSLILQLCIHPEIKKDAENIADFIRFE